MNIKSFHFALKVESIMINEKLQLRGWFLSATISLYLFMKEVWL